MKKATKRILTILAFVVGLSYFTFTLVLFDPFEGSYLDDFEGLPVALEYVVPRNVDFFAHKRALENDFEIEEFPVPGVWDTIRFNRTWRRFEETPLYEDKAISCWHPYPLRPRPRPPRCRCWHRSSPPRRAGTGARRSASKSRPEDRPS